MGLQSRIWLSDWTEWTQLNWWLIHVEAWQKTTKFCKAIILQFKKKNNAEGTFEYNGKNFEMNNKHQTTDPGSLENTKWDKYPSLKKKKKKKEKKTIPRHTRFKWQKTRRKRKSPKKPEKGENYQKWEIHLSLEQFLIIAKNEAFFPKNKTTAKVKNYRIIGSILIPSQKQCKQKNVTWNTKFFERCKESTWRRKWQPTPVFFLGNPIDREAWWTTIHGVPKESDTT